MRQGIYFFCFILFLLASCSHSTTEDLMKVDREFSALSAEAGMKKAFLEYADDSAVLLQNGVMPLRGKEALINSFKQFSDEDFELIWEPLAGEISRSGDLGFTYGLYTTTLHADSSIHRGKYVTIWKKQADGSWKFVLDGGNEGL